MSPTPDLESLLNQDRWIRRIALKLAGDAQTADDLAQETWLIVRQRPQASRGWLRGVLANLWRETLRSNGRRQQREEASARPEAQPSTLELVEELSLRREVSAALLALDEPYRRAIYLRFHREMELKAIARKTGVALSTVHDRIRIGLGRMRAQLDDGPVQGRWAPGLLALGKQALPVTPILGAISIGIGIKIAAASIVLIGALTWSFSEGSRQRNGGLEAQKTGVYVAQNATPQLDQPEESTEATGLRTGFDLAGLEPSGPNHLQAGRVLDSLGNPLTQVRVGYDSSSLSLSGPGGIFELSPPEKELGPSPVRSFDRHYATVIPGRPDATGEALLIVAPRVGFAGEVLDKIGVPVENAKLDLRIHQSLYHLHRIDRPWGKQDQRRTTKSDPKGHFELRKVPGGDGIFLHVAAVGFEPQRIPLAAAGDGNMRIVLQPGAGILVSGLVLDQRGLPLSDASISAGEEIATSDKDGLFRLLWDPKATAYAKQNAEGTWIPQPIPHFITALKPGHGLIRKRLTELDTDRDIILQIESSDHSLWGRIVDPSGMGRAAVEVWASDLTHFGIEEHSLGDHSPGKHVDVESMMSANGEHRVLTDDDGGFHLGHLLDREYSIHALDRSSLETIRAQTFLAGISGLTIQLQMATTRTVAGRILSLSGAPLAGVKVTGFTRNSDNTVDVGARATLDQTTGKDGRFRFERIVTEGLELTLYRSDFLWKHKRVSMVEDLKSLEYEIPLNCEVIIDLENSPNLADSFEFLNEDGKTMEVSESFGVYLTLKRRVELIGHRSNLLKLAENARILVFYKNDLEVSRQEVLLDPKTRTTIQP